MRFLTQIAALAGLAAAILGVGYWVQSVESRLKALESAKPVDAKAATCAELARALPGARGKTKAGYIAATQQLGCSN